MSVGLTLPIAIAGAVTLKTAGDFELSMNKVQALTSATATEFSALQGQARELGATTMFTASQAGDAMGFLALAGFKTNEILSAMPGTLELAAAAQMELGEAADTVSGILRGYQLQTSDLARVNDVLTKTFTSTNTTLQMLGEGMTYVAPIASAMKLPIEEVSAAMGILANNNIRASMAGTSLRKALATLAAPSREAERVLVRLRIPRGAILDSMGNVRSLTAVVRELEKSGATAGDLMTIFGQRAGPAMAALVNTGSEALANLRTQLEDSAGTTAQVAAVQMRGLVGQLRALKSAFQEVQLAIAESGMLEFFTKIFSKMAGFLRQLAKMNPEIFKWATVILGVIAVIGPLLFVVGQMTIAINALIPVIVAFGGALMWLAANPIVWIIAAIAAVVVGLIMLWKNWDTISGMWVTGVRVMANAVVGFFRWMWGGIKTFIDKAIKFLMKLLKVILMVMFPLPFLAAKLGAKFLPENVRAKLGFLTGEGGTSSTPTDILREERVQKNEFQGVMRFENVPSGARVEIEKGEIDLETDTGLLLGTP
jgi:TP901 family phage tail tape measure protein